MMRTRLLTVLVTLVALAAPAASADDEGVPVQDTVKGGVPLEAQRARVEALYRKAAGQHAKLRAFADTLRDREPGAWPEPLAAEPARVAVETFVEKWARGRTVDPGIDRPVAPTLLAIDEWKLWAPAVKKRTEERIDVEPEALAVDVFVGAVLDVADMATADGWDRYFQGHKVVRAWRRANGVPESVVDVEDADETLLKLLRRPLVALAKGRFEVGPWEGWLQDLSEKENRPQTVSVGALHVQKTEVSCASYFWFLAEVGSTDRSAVPSLLPQGWTIAEAGYGRFPDGHDDHPVTGVSFLQATAYAEWLGMRLPTEDEWERIASAGDPSRLFPWGAEVGDKLFAHRGTADGETTPVDRFPDDVSASGVLGLAGNVKELVATHPDRKPVKGTLEPDDRVVIRGGGFRTRAEECTTRWRWFVEAGAQKPDVGFRCVVDDTVLQRLERQTPRRRR